MDFTDEKNLFESLENEGLDEYLPVVYNELKKLAAYHLRNERPNHTLRPTELVHEVYLLLQKQHSLNLQDRKIFMSLSSAIMRRVLVNYAKHRNRKKRGDGKANVAFDEAENVTLIEFGQDQIDVIALEESLDRLAEFDPRQVKIIEMCFYGGLTFDEIAGALGVSSRTIMREWKFARAWLYNNLNRS